MFLGIREIFSARGRFALIAAVVGLLTLLLVMLTGLTGGLGQQNTAGLESLKADRLVFGSAGSQEPEVSFTSSSVTAGEQKIWANQDGVDSATPVGISQTVLEGSAASPSIAVFGIPAGSSLLHDSVGQALEGSTELSDSTVVLGETIAQDSGAKVGDKVTISGNTFTVGGIVADTYYSHTPVMWADTAAWQKIGHVNAGASQQPADQEIVGTVLAISAPHADDAALTSAADQSGTKAVTTKESFQGLAAFQSERGSLQAMQGFLYGISALVTLSFLTVWTIQRTRDLAVLRALGASTGYLLHDAMIQAAIILFGGAALGALLGWVLGALAQNALPFQLDLLTVLGPAVGIWAIGLAGSFIATARITKIDPMIALGGN